MQDTSLSLLERVSRSADSESWDRLVQLYSPLLTIWLRRFDVQSSDVDDLIQEVLTVMVRELPGFQHNQRTGAFRRWMRTILGNRVKQYWRSRKYRPEAKGGSSFVEQLARLDDDRSDISLIWDQQHDSFVMNRLLEIVRPRFESQTWEAFQRQVVDGQRADKVAAELDLSIGSVYMAKSRILNALRREAAGLIEFP